MQAIAEFCATCTILADVFWLLACHCVASNTRYQAFSGIRAGYGVFDPSSLVAGASFTREGFLP